MDFKYIFNAIGWLGFMTCLIIIIFLNQASKSPMVVNAKTEIHKYYDSSVKTLPAEKIKIPVPVTFTVPIPVNMIVDTAAILQAYFNLNYYVQTIEDTCLRAIIKDSVTQNKIRYRGFSYQWLQPIKTVEQTTITTEQPKRMNILAGGFAEINQGFVTGYGPTAALQLKNGTLISANYDLKKYFINHQHAFEVSTQFPLFKNARTHTKNK